MPPAFVLTVAKISVSGSTQHAKMTNMLIDVDCYSGYKADERPVRFRLDGHEYLVEELLDQWYGQDDVFFKVRAVKGGVKVGQ
ncbi:MAG: hypothetical protein CXZ00_13410 [Acidobacteria bacterium]|nr:MAG: hypothetical protein CXZ00_13410 [Acidobacteriota bacterium]